MKHFKCVIHMDHFNRFTRSYLKNNFDASVEVGTLEGRGNSAWFANKRLKAYRCMLVAASTLIDAGYIGWGCLVLERCDMRADGMPRPPDFIIGEAREELIGMILQLMADLGCSN